MKTAISSFITIYQFTTGRMLFALAKVADEIDERDDDELAPIADHVGKALKHARMLRDLEMEYATGKHMPRNNLRTPEIDAKLDRALVTFRDIVQAYADADTGDEDPRRALAHRLLLGVFPDGVQDVVQAPFVEQLSKVEGVLRKLKLGHTKAIEAMGLEYLVGRIAELTDEYRAAQKEDTEPIVEFGRVREARERAQEFLVEVVAMIAGRFPTNGPKDLEVREALLRPVIVQHDAIGAGLKSRRGSADDVDPETGEVVAAPVPSSTPPREEAETLASE